MIFIPHAHHPSRLINRLASFRSSGDFFELAEVVPHCIGPLYPYGREGCEHPKVEITPYVHVILAGRSRKPGHTFSIFQPLLAMVWSVYLDGYKRKFFIRCFDTMIIRLKPILQGFDPLIGIQMLWINNKDLLPISPLTIVVSIHPKVDEPLVLRGGIASEPC